MTADPRKTSSDFEEFDELAFQSHKVNKIGGQSSTTSKDAKNSSFLFQT